MGEEKPKIYKRIGAFIIDILIVSLLSGIITMTFTDTTKYTDVTKEMTDIMRKYQTKEMDIEEYNARFKELNYESVSSSINVTIITLAVTIVYYVIMPYFCHGITLGKSLMKIRMISNNYEELNILNYFLRSLIINSVLSSATIIIMFYSLSKNDYINIESKVNGIISLLFIVSLILVMYRKDGRGLHDIIANTKVVNIDYKKEDEDEKLKEATVISEKKKTKKEEGK